MTRSFVVAGVEAPENAQERRIIDPVEFNGTVRFQRYRTGAYRFLTEWCPPHYDAIGRTFEFKALDCRSSSKRGRDAKPHSRLRLLPYSAGKRRTGRDYQERDAENLFHHP